MIEDVGFKRMTNFEYLSSDKLVQRTTFSNGSQVIVNFSEADYKLPNGKILKSWDYVLLKK